MTPQATLEAVPLFVFRFSSWRGPQVGLQIGEARFNLTAFDPLFSSIGAWLAHPEPADVVRNIAQKLINTSEYPAPDDAALLAPVDNQTEVWAAGVTYERSKTARQEESDGGGDFYDKVYNAARPELFFKSLPSRVSGPNALIRIRADSTWDVPEPEMTLVVSSRGEIVGVTAGNDVSSRSIEGENPLYLPQAKTYDNSCALGPLIRVMEAEMDLQTVEITLFIVRNGSVAFSEQTNTARMKRRPQELAAYLFREITFPFGAFLMTGTGIVPPDSFTLQSGDVVSITLAGVGTLTNPVA